MRHVRGYLLQVQTCSFFETRCKPWFRLECRAERRPAATAVAGASPGPRLTPATAGTDRGASRLGRLMHPSGGQNGSVA